MRGNAAHWKVVEDERVQRVARNAANSIERMNVGIVEAEDLYQEGLILIAGTPKIAEHAIVGDLGMVYNEVRERLFKKFIRPLDRTGELDARKYKTITHDDMDDEPAPYVQFDDGTGDYTEDAIRVLMPAIWDESYAYSLPDRDDQPDADMPKATGNKAHKNNHWAYIADIKTGWKDTPLSLEERRALLMSFGLGWRQSEIARHESVVQSVVSGRINRGIKKITARLNGAHIVQED